MNTTERLMEKYLDSKISWEENQVLGDLLSGNPKLKNELAFRKEVNSIMMDEDIRRLRMHLDDAYNSTYRVWSSSSLPTSRGRVKKVLYAAAAIAGITVGGLSLLEHKDSKLDPISLYRESFEPYPPLNFYRENQEWNNKFSTAMRYYQNGKFLEASKELESLLRENPTSTSVKFYLGITYLELEEYQNSTLVLREVMVQDSLFAQQANWYYGLGHLAQKNIPEAIASFDRIKTIDNDFGKKANTLTKKLLPFIEQ